MKISFNKFDTMEESYFAAQKSEDGRAAPLSGSELGIDSKDKAEDNKKAAFAQSGDRVEISEEARELQRVAATENPEAENEQGERSESGNASGGVNGPEAAGGNESPENEAVEKLKQMIKAAEKRLQKAEEKLMAAKAEAGGAVDEAAQMAGQQNIEAAQAEVQSIQGELQTLRGELQEALQGRRGGSVGGNIAGTRAKGGVGAKTAHIGEAVDPYA